MNRTTTFLTVATMVAALGTASAARAEGHIQWRKDNQQRRIAQGIASGQLTAREAFRLEGRESALNHEIRAMRWSNGGTLTAGERFVINRQQGRISGAIYRLKHNGCSRP